MTGVDDPAGIEVAVNGSSLPIAAAGASCSGCSCVCNSGSAPASGTGGAAGVGGASAGSVGAVSNEVEGCGLAKDTGDFTGGTRGEVGGGGRATITGTANSVPSVGSNCAGGIASEASGSGGPPRFVCDEFAEDGGCSAACKTCPKGSVLAERAPGAPAAGAFVVATAGEAARGGAGWTLRAGMESGVAFGSSTAMSNCGAKLD